MYGCMVVWLNYDFRVFFIKGIGSRIDIKREYCYKNKN